MEKGILSAYGYAFEQLGAHLRLMAGKMVGDHPLMIVLPPGPRHAQPQPARDAFRMSPLPNVPAERKRAPSQAPV